ncbi:MAG: hypothetical protein ACLQBK_25770 [Candidatus Sulfotelmatobacter sp.]
MAETYKPPDNAKHAELDRALDAALAKYAAVEPRAGLEQRLLANLRAERAQVPDRAWWRWSLAAALTAVVVVALALAWRSGGPSHRVVENPPSPTPQSAQTSAQVSSNDDRQQIRGTQSGPQERGARRRAAIHRAQPKVVIATIPKLDQFPSPQPLSEQETILKSYVAKYPEQAVLIARAVSEARRQDQLEEMKALSGDRATGSEEPNHDTTER